jgi:integrase/recombinase XerC
MTSLDTMPDALPTPDALAVIPLAPALDGHHGSNRARGGVCQIAAQTDLDAVRLWLAEHADSPHTLRCYRKEAARLLLWAARVPGKPLSGLTREDLLAYEAFLASPTLEWLEPGLPRRGPGRRLFEGPLSARSVRQALGILSGLFGYLVAAGYVSMSKLMLF